MAKNIAVLFNSIAKDYDFLNHLLSFQIDKYWRRKALKDNVKGAENVLDIACGTADFSIALTKYGAKKIVGVDISEEMMEVGRQKVAKKNLSSQITLQYGDCSALEFNAESFDLATVAFGVRNFQKRAESLKEICRVIKPKSKLIVLEFSTPQHFPVKQLYKFYFKHILPTIGGIVSGNKAAYTYLHDSVYAFPQGEAFLEELREAGFSRVTEMRLTFGIVTVYFAEK